MAEETTTLKLPADLAAQLRFLAAARCSTLEDEIVSQLRNALIRFSEGGGGGAGGAGSGSSLFLTSPIIGLVEGLLTAETTVGEGMQHGNFGLGTLNHVRVCSCDACCPQPTCPVCTWGAGLPGLWGAWPSVECLKAAAAR
jgi:hypothetical protein